MAKDQFTDLHLFAMESALPFGLGIINSAKKGGLKKIIEVVRTKDPFSEFQANGATAAKIVRDNIDQVIPGLGNPVVSVDVTVEDNYQENEIKNQDALTSALNRIDKQLDKLRHYLKNDYEKIDKK